MKYKIQNCQNCQNNPRISKKQFFKTSKKMENIFSAKKNAIRLVWPVEDISL